MGLFDFLKPNANRKEVHHRSNYKDPSRRFLEWVDGLGFEQTSLGSLVYRLDQRFALRRLVILFSFCLVLSYLIFSDFDFTYSVRAGDIAVSDIKSPISFQIIDEAASESKRQEAEKSIPPVFDYDPDAYETLFNDIYKAFREMRREFRSVQWPRNESEREEVVKDFLKFKPQFERDLGQAMSDRLFESLIDLHFSARVENLIIRTLVGWSNFKITEGPTTVLPDANSPLIVRVIQKGRAVAPATEYTLTADQIKFAKDTDSLKLELAHGGQGLDRKDREAILRIAQSLVIPNLTFNRQETTSRRHSAREAVLPVQISLKKNQTIVSAGAIIQPIHMTILSEIRSLRSDRRVDFISLVAALLLVVVITVFFSYTRRFTSNRVRVEDRDLWVMGIVTMLTVGITKLFLFMTDASFIARFGNFIPPNVFLYAAPVAAGPMLVGLVITSGEVVWLFTAFLALAIAMIVDMNFNLLLMSLIGGIAAARGVYNCKKRNDIYFAGLRAGLINAAVIGLLTLVQKTGEADLLSHLLWSVPAGLFSGVFSAMIAMTLVPLIESMFNYTTDVKLLELANLNHPLMHEMIVKAPGTYHHSISVGSMVEAAATEIGANALLGKVMAYYHDIGKMEHAQYFIENQRKGNNPHDHVSPYMSKTILIAHVKDGAELGLRYKLGKPIIDGILQHHGTTLISYFYNRALEAQDEDISQVKEEDFRYPGPKPQFREAALVMLADSIEAAARSLEEPTPARLQNIVKNIIQTKFLDGQLEQCNLTLRDLSVIEQAFNRVLLGIYHQRIDYPKINRVSPSLAKPAQGRNKRGSHSA